MADDAVVTGAPTGAPQTTGTTTTDKPEVDTKITAFINSWVERIKSVKGATRTKLAFERMDKCMQLAKDGADKDWVQGDKNYVVPLLNRLTNQAVAQLYAKNPTAEAKRKKRRMATVWDGTLSSLNEAKQAMMNSSQMMQPPDPNMAAILQDAEVVKQYDIMMDGVADTLTILHNYFIQDPAAQYKQQFKALVRRTKVCGVGYVKLSYQRILEVNPDVMVKLNDATEQLATMRQLMASASRDELPEDSVGEEQLKTLIDQLQQEPELIVQEGPVLSFPRSKAIIIDPACVQLKTLAGADWTAEEYEKTPAQIEEIWKVDISGQYTEYKSEDANWQRWEEKDGELNKTQAARVWRVMNRKTGQEFVIAEGYKDYIKPPAPPDIKLKRFFDIFPLVFNEVESEEDLYPPSDIWNGRHLQSEYNRSRQGLREHRLMNRPGYVASKGTFEENDLDAFESHAIGAIIETSVQITGEQKISDLIQAKPVMQIDPKQYETDSIWADILRVMGQQQADSGPTAESTATESSIAENSRQIGISDSSDDIDDILSLLAQAMGEIMLTEMSPDTVKEIVGPGAVWPSLPQTREEIAESITLSTKAGASGRPNQAADLQKLQTAMPFILQVPGINPIPIGEKFMGLLDIDIQAAVVEGLPSMQAQNNVAAKPPTPAAGAPPGGPPGAQGAAGGQNAPRPAGATPGPQPAFPAPAMHA